VVNINGKYSNLKADESEELFGSNQKLNKQKRGIKNIFKVFFIFLLFYDSLAASKILLIDLD